MRWVREYGKTRGAYRTLVGRFDGMRLFARPRRRWEHNIKMELREMGWGGMG